jgi:hypothetical protein
MYEFISFMYDFIHYRQQKQKNEAILFCCI